MSATTARADVEQVLARFNQATQDSDLVESANDFFRQLHEEGFLDTLYIYKLTTSADTLRAQVWYWAAERCYDQQQYAQAIDYGKRALPLCRATAIESDCLNLLAISCVRLSDFVQALDYAKQCYALDEATGDPDVMSSSLNTLAAIYIGGNQPAEAEKYVLKGIDLARQAGNRQRESILLGMASEMYHALDIDSLALAYAEQGYELEQQLGQDYKAHLRLSQKASALMGLDRLDEARQTLVTTIPFFRQVGDRHSLGIDLIRMGRISNMQHREEQAADYYREAVDIFEQLGDAHSAIYAHRGLYEALWKSNPEEARFHMERSNHLKDSLYSHASAESLARYNAEFGVDWLQQENRQQRSAKWWAIGVAIALAVVALVLWLLLDYRARRFRHKAEHLAAELDELEQQYEQLNQQYDIALKTSTGNSPVEQPGTANDFLEHANAVLEQLMRTKQVDAEHLASHLNMSLFQLRQRLAIVAEVTPQAFIAIARMRKARQLLDTHPEMTVSEVAMACAYADTPHFSRAFKKTFGITPTQYVEQRATV